jgi:WD40 repeat protein
MDLNPPNGILPSPGESFPPVAIPDHQLLRRIGRGSYGEVWLARTTTGMYRAVKIVYRNAFEQQRPFERELSGIRKFEPISRSHEGFIDVLHVGINEEQGYFFYVMELGDDRASGQNIDPANYSPKTLSGEIALHGKLPFQDCLELGLALSLALAELHKHGLVHRDVKPSNIIFVNGVPKLADIGLVAGVDEARSYVGTEGFIPPEGPGSPAADIFSLGKVLYEAGTGKDRQQFPELPTRLDQLPDRNEFLELNEVILLACQNDPRQRYRSAWDLHADLLVLANGKSVKRLRLLERRLARFKRIASVSALALIALAAVFYQVYREWRSAAETRQQQAGANIAYGNRALESGDLLGALPCFAEALRQDQGNPNRETQHRLRFGSVLRQCPKLAQMWFAPKGLVSARFSADGRSVLAVEEYGQAQVFHPDADPSLSLRFGQEPGLRNGDFRPDGTLAVTVSDDGTASVWRVSDGVELLTLEHPGAVLSAAYSADGRRIVTGCQDGVARVWDAAAGTLQLVLKGHTDGILSVRFSRDGRRIATAARDGLARVWDAGDGQAIGSPLIHSTWVTCAAFSPDAQQLVTGCFDHKAHVWDLATGREIPPAMDHLDGVYGAEFSPDGRLIATASLDRTARLWLAADHKPLNPNPILRHSDRVRQVTFASDGHGLVTACADGTVRVWDLAGMAVAPTPAQCVFSPNASHFALTTNQTLVVGATSSDRFGARVFTNASAAEKVEFSGDGRFVLALFGPLQESNGTVRVLEVWDATSGRQIAPALVLRDSSTRFALSRDGRSLLTWTGKVAQTWNVHAGKPVCPRIQHDADVQGGVFSPDGTRVATWDGEEVKVWSADSGQELFQSLQHPAPVAHVEFSPDGRRLVTGCSERAFRKCYAQVWSMATGQPVSAPLNHADGVLHASFSPDGRRVVTASEDFTALVWDAVTGKQLTPPLRHEHQVWSARFSPDGKWIVTAGLDRAARIWNAETGDPLTPPLRHPARLVNACFSADGRRIVTSDRAGRSWTWELPVDERPVADLVDVAYLLAGDVVKASGRLPAPRPESLQTLWGRLRNKYPSTFTASEQEIAVWHEFQAEQCEAAGQWSGAVFHLEQLLALQPGNLSFAGRLGHAREQAGSADGRP